MELKELWPLISESIKDGGQFTMIPRGISMLPLIRPARDEVVLVEPIDIKKTDIVLYRRDDGKFVLHRVMYIKKGEYIMCGDNQSCLERGIEERHLLAKVSEIHKDGRVVDTTTKEYEKYLKKLYKKIRRARIRRFLGRIKRIFIKKKKIDQ